MAGFEEDDHLDEEMLTAELPNSDRGLVACIPCMLIKTYTQFYESGCENCPWLQMDSEDVVKGATTAHYDGMVALMNPEKSWVGRWQRIDKLKPGCYAVRVNEDATPDVLEMMGDRPNLGKLSREED